MALFTEKYKDSVRFVEILDSKELCGGCHVKNTKEIKKFAIVSFENKGANTYRITGATKNSIETSLLKVAKVYNDNIVKNIMKAKNISMMAKKDGIKLDTKIVFTSNKIMSYKDLVELKKLDKEIANEVHEYEKNYQKLLSEKAVTNLDIYIENIKEINNIKLLLLKVNDEDNNALKNILDTLANKYENIFMLIANIKEDTPTFIARSNSTVDAGGVIKFISAKSNGNGGGSNKFARGAGKTCDYLDEAFNIIQNEWI